MRAATAATLLLLLGMVLHIVTAETVKGSKVPGNKPGTCPPSPPTFAKCLEKIPWDCVEDSKCPGNKKCCLYACRYQCQEPQPKPGGCPPTLARCRTPLPPPLCHSDYDCDGNEKCCTPLCTQKCTPPVLSNKKGTCPPSPPTFAACPKEIPQDCVDDSKCPGNKKCCLYACRFQCKEPKQSKSGTCPPSPPTFAPCPEVLPRDCMDDSKCPGNKKCCPYACRYECHEPQPKPGECPIPSTRCRTPLPPPLCQSDHDCDGDQKCCTPECTQKCTPPIPKSKSGTCPLSPPTFAPCPEVLPRDCMDDSKCPGNKKCCPYACRYECHEPQPKPGECPIPSTRCRTPLPPPLCQSDHDCDGDQKCCTPECTQKCTPPVLKSKSGTCPPSPPTFAPCPEVLPRDCMDDSKCPGKKKCCPYACRYECHEPQPKPGECPIPSTRCRTPLPPPLCLSDHDCDGDQKCCTPECTQKCTPPVPKSKSGTCPPSPPTFAPCPEVLPRDCMDDSKCPGNKKCCPYACRYVCHEPQPKPGDCPIPSTSCLTPLPPPLCHSDHDCDGDQKCCTPECTQKCTPPVPKSKSGTCPPSPPTFAPCPEVLPRDCMDDSKCPGNKKCCPYACRYECHEPEPKPGKCPVSVTSCRGSSPPPECHNDYDCKEDQKCCTSECTQKCTSPLSNNKSGKCPPARLSSCPEEIPRECSDHSVCPGHKKCCLKDCRYQCLEPQPKVGDCPVPSTECNYFPAYFLAAPEECKSDHDCDGDLKCCITDCNRKCTPPVAIRDSSYEEVGVKG